MYIGHGRLCVCLSVPCRIPALLHRLGFKLGEWWGCPLVVHYWADLQSVHGSRCYDNSAKREMSASACTCSMHGLIICGVVLVGLIITNGQRDLTKCRIATAHGLFSRILQVAPMCTPI